MKDLPITAIPTKDAAAMRVGLFLASPTRAV